MSLKLRWRHSWSLRLRVMSWSNIVVVYKQCINYFANSLQSERRRPRERRKNDREREREREQRDYHEAP
jgi:hypothetical protein